MSLEKILAFAEKAYQFATHEDVLDFASKIWDLFASEKMHGYKDDNTTIVAKALHRMNDGRPPRIALVGMTSAGKSSLVNALFGTPIAEVSRTPDTTNAVLEVKFPSGLTIFDTPGISGNEVFENITRAFLGLEQDSFETESSIQSQIPISTTGLQSMEWYSIDEIPNRIHSIDGVIFVVDASRTQTRHDRIALKNFYLELDKKFPGKVVSVGTHADALDKMALEERKKMLDTYRNVTNNTLISVSTTSGSGLDDVVIAIFSALPDMVSPSKLQESLTYVRKLGRLDYVINEASNLLAEITLLKGNQKKEIKAASIYLFASICKHYSVNEAAWMSHHGNIAELAHKTEEAGINRKTESRDPKGFLETIQAFFGEKFTRDAIIYDKIGIKGLQILLPSTYKMLHELSECNLPICTNINIKLNEQETKINVAISWENKPVITETIRGILKLYLCTD